MPDTTQPAPTPTTGPLASRYVDVATVAWEKTRFEGVEWKILMEDKERGLLTALMRWAPGARLPLHEHVEIEQTWVLEGSFEDHQGVCTAGNYVWRPRGSRHEAWTRDGAVMLAVFLSPNRFFDQG